MHLLLLVCSRSCYHCSAFCYRKFKYMLKCSLYLAYQLLRGCYAYILYVGYCKITCDLKCPLYNVIAIENYI